MKYLVILVLLTIGCSPKFKYAGVTLEKINESAKSRGKAVYDLNCIGCHNADPAVKGPVGPELVGSSKELLTAKLLKGTYPKGYKPKRVTSYMPTYPNLENDIPNLAEFLKEAE